MKNHDPLYGPDSTVPTTADTAMLVCAYCGREFAASVFVSMGGVVMHQFHDRWGRVCCDGCFDPHT